jgi:RHS repeat-associated protein
LKYLKILYVQVLIAICLGVLTGYLFPEFSGTAKLISEMFINLIKMIIGPVIFISIVLGIASAGDLKKVGRVGVKGLVYFELVTTAAIIIGLLTGNIIRPGDGISHDLLTHAEAAQAATKSTAGIDWKEFISHIIPSNVIDSFAKGDIIQVLFFGILFAIALSKMGETGRSVITGFEKINKILFNILHMVIRVSPIGAFGGMAYTIGKFGFATLFLLGKLMITFYLTGVLFIFITKYDALGRIALTGTWSNSNGITDQVTLRGLVDAPSVLWQVKDLNASWNVQGYVLDNNLNNDPVVLDQVLSVNYYDDYTFPSGNPVYPYVQNTAIVDMPLTASTMTKGLLTASKVNVLGTDDMLWTVSYYDDKGRGIQSNMQHYLGGTLSTGNHDEISNGYDFTNGVTQTSRRHYVNGTNTLNIGNEYVYDHMGRKRQTFEQINNDSKILLSQIDYNEVGQALNKHLHSENEGASYLQNLTYAYNERGWLTTSATDGNLFNLNLNYNTTGTGITPQWNGNISAMGYNVNKPTQITKQFLYSYDALNRLNIATSTGNLLDETIAYDKMGNITSLTRGGTSVASLGYNYLDGNGNYSNQLTSVTNNSAGYRSYAYDGNGNATSDGGSQTINYNMLNLPQSVVQAGTTKATYTYEASGTKVRNTGTDGIWDYDNGIVYKDNTIQFVQTEEGRATRNVSDGTYHYEYNLKDHLGNTRVSFDKGTNGNARIIQEDEYYSFGLRNLGGYDNSNNNRYLYNGKEIQTDLANQYDYGARFYDPVIARWTSVDPLAEQGRRFSPYNYVYDDPMKFTDPDGMWPKWSEIKQAASAFGKALSDDINGALQGVRAVLENPKKLQEGLDNLTSPRTIGKMGGALGRTAATLSSGTLTQKAAIAGTITGEVAQLAGGEIGELVKGSEIVKVGEVAKDAGATLKANKIAGAVGEDFLSNQFGGEPQAGFSTTQGRRVVDNLTPEGVAQESKVGRTSLTKRVKAQIAKDVELVNTPGNGVNSAQWNFFSGTTGVGPTGPLSNALKFAGIPYIVH